MLLGVLLALAAGTIVIYVVSSALGPTTQTKTVVVATKTLTSSTILSSTTSDASHLLISDAFATKSVNADFVPADAYVYSSATQLAVDLNDKVVIGQFYAGDILRQDDPRLVALGQGAPGSLTNRNPAELPKGSVIFPLEGLKVTGLVAGDHVDVLVTLCAGTTCGSEADVTQTTLENVLVYASDSNTLDLVLTHEEALELKFLTEHGQVSLALRKPGDTDPSDTTPVTLPYIVQHFKFTP
jgi:Flp pilus assembly protein CpaB